MSDVAHAPAFAASCSCLRRWTGRKASDDSELKLRIMPGSAAHSGIVARMSRRGMGEQMPPLGTELVDQAGVATISAWIDALDPTACLAAEPECPVMAAAGAGGGGGAMAGAPAPASAGHAAP